MNDCKSVFGLFDFFSIQNQLNARFFFSEQYDDLCIFIFTRNKNNDLFKRTGECGWSHCYKRKPGKRDGVTVKL